MRPGRVAVALFVVLLSAPALILTVRSVATVSRQDSMGVAIPSLWMAAWVVEGALAAGWVFDVRVPRPLTVAAALLGVVSLLAMPALAWQARSFQVAASMLGVLLAFTTPAALLAVGLVRFHLERDARPDPAAAAE